MAYWNINQQKINAVSVPVGSWTFQYPAWTAGVVYPIGTIVIHNNQTWIKTKDGGLNSAPSTKPPGRNFWSLYN